MIKFFRLILGAMVLGIAVLASAVITMSFAIHGAEVNVPDLQGLTIAEAVRKTAGEELNLGIDNKYYSAEVPAGRILTQSPDPGTVVRREWRVRVTESLGPQRVTIPDVVGLDERVAAVEVHRLGLELEETSEMPAPNVPPGMVIAQNPQKGSEAARPSISLLVSGAPTTVGKAYVMPQLVGMPYAAATSLITHAGFKIGPMMDDNSAPAGDDANNPGPPLPPGMILTQTPQAGNRVDGNTYIALTISQ